MRARIGLVAAGLVVFIVIAFLAMFTKPNAFWAVHEITYKSTINSLPSPPGAVPGTNRLHSGPEYRYAERRFDVIGGRNEIVDYFRMILPERGWNYVGERLISADPNDPAYAAGRVYAEVTVLAFQNVKDQCLEVTVALPIPEAGTTEAQPARVEYRLVEIRNGSRIDPCEDYDTAG